LIKTTQISSVSHFKLGIEALLGGPSQQKSPRILVHLCCQEVNLRIFVWYGYNRIFW